MPTTEAGVPARSYDVVVIGGGTSGVVAAVQAARAGATVLLVEKNGLLGGTMTMGGICFPGLFYAWGHQVIAGIGWELVTRCRAECGQEIPDVRDPDPHWTGQIRLDPAIYAALCDEAVTESGADLLLHTMVAAVQGEGAAWRVTLCTKTGLTDVAAQVLIDATGDATVVELAGYPVVAPPTCQPATLSCHATGYDLQALDLPALNRAFEAEVQAGRLRYTDVSWDTHHADVGRWLQQAGGNVSHTASGPARGSWERTALELAARRSLLRLFRFLRKQPGLGELRITSLSPECGVRESATIVGERTICAEDYVSGRLWEDAVCYSYYPIDLHTAEGDGLDVRRLSRGTVPTVPRGALLPAGSCNLVVAGRCLASDRLANSALRVQATSMATGQAAGAMAALAAATHADMGSVPMADIRDLLRQHGAIVPEGGPETQSPREAGPTAGA